MTLLRLKYTYVNKKLLTEFWMQVVVLERTKRYGESVEKTNVGTYLHLYIDSRSRYQSTARIG